ncbi:MAG: hypothetical protein A4E71_00541 [Smithella sp. PtaU1.Bin162]|nr:MAG: hypothetical protein A4E71_00541 [Smithella sp. PtaU1.Bin162]
MYLITQYKFFNEEGQCNTVTENKDGKLVCDCIEFARFGTCDHSVVIEAEQVPQIFYRRLR